MSVTCKTASAAVELFLGRTAMRRSPQRDRLVEEIAKSPRPMTKAKALLQERGVRTVSEATVRSAVIGLQARTGTLDPVFRPRIEAAYAAAREGAWTAPDQANLMAALKLSWRPFSDDCTRTARKAFSRASERLREEAEKAEAKPS